MKKCALFVLSISLLLFSCEVDNVGKEALLESVSGKGQKAKNTDIKLLKECKVINADRCNYSNYAASSFWWPKEGVPQGLFSVGNGYEMSYLEYDDGSINIKGQTELDGCIATIDLWLVGKTNLEDWIDKGGLFKDEIESASCSEVLAELLNYYTVDETRSNMTASGCEERDGNYYISHRPTDERYGFQVGPGGALFDSGDDYGVSGWASAINKETGESHILDFNFTIGCTNDEKSCETAFARGKDGATCFIGNGFSRWGWTLGPLSEGNYTYEIYAGAGQCDINKGNLVGTVDVSYQMGDVTVTYNIDNTFTTEETHTYAGNLMFPIGNNGKPTVAPGQYSISENLSGEIYVIAHAVVCAD